MEPTTLTGLDDRRAVLDGIFPASQTALQFTLWPEILARLIEVTRNADPYFISSYVSSMLTPVCLPESEAMLARAIDELSGELDSTALRFLKEAHQADGECLAIRNLQ